MVPLQSTVRLRRSCRASALRLCASGCMKESVQNKICPTILLPMLSFLFCSGTHQGTSLGTATALSYRPFLFLESSCSARRVLRKPASMVGSSMPRRSFVATPPICTQLIRVPFLQALSDLFRGFGNVNDGRHAMPTRTLTTTTTTTTTL